MKPSPEIIRFDQAWKRDSEARERKERFESFIFNSLALASLIIAVCCVVIFLVFLTEVWGQS